MRDEGRGKRDKARGTSLPAVGRARGIKKNREMKDLNFTSPCKTLLTIRLLKEFLF
jgi:hypothetical protein